MSRMPYSFAVLRYVHDVATQECLNVGVVLFVPSGGYIKAKIQHEYSRLSQAFEGFQGEYYRKVAKHIESRINALSERWIKELPFDDRPLDARMVANMILPHDDSSLQFSESSRGLTTDPDYTLDELFTRYVLRNQTSLSVEHRTKEEVWKTFRNELMHRNVIGKLQPVVIKGNSFEYEFSHAWKNRQWHPLEPISMDAKEGETLCDRAVRWLGRATALQGDSNLGTLYMLIGRPESDSLRSAYIKAKNLLHDMPIKHELIDEDEAADFAMEFSSLVSQHEEEDAAPKS